MYIGVSQHAVRYAESATGENAAANRPYNVAAYCATEAVTSLR